jgi:N-methylhydantoinase A
VGRYWLGIDIGGTFTDFTLYDTATHGVTGLKVPSTPPDFAQAVEHGLDALAGEHRIDLREIDVAVHGTTIAVNTLIQRTGARLGLLVTEGFRDVLEIQRLRLPNPLDMHGGRPEPLIPRARVAEVRERLRADGRVDTALDEAGVATAARRLADEGAEGLVISLIHAYRDPSHERRARAVAEAAAPGVPVSTSHEVWPEAREYERTALAVLDAYVQPKVRRYLEGFEAALRARAVPAVAHVTKSNGGIMPVAAARRQTVATLLSGPASGVIGAAYVAGAAGLGNLITLDVGGTSADIAVVEDGRPRSSTAEQIGGIPVMMPVVGVTAIGAGGGSVAWVDEVGVPKVGPQSTGANPGPACYGAAARRHALRRLRGLGISRPRAIPRRPDAPRPLSGRGGDPPLRRSARHGRQRGGGERRARRGVEHVRRLHQDPLPGRHRSAGLRAGGLRRGGPAGGQPPRPRGGHPHRLRAALAGHAVRPRRHHRRHPERRGADGARAPRRARPPRARP